MVFPRFASMKRSNAIGIDFRWISCSSSRARSSFDIAKCDIKTRPRRASDAPVCLYRTRRTTGSKCASQPPRRSDERVRHPGLRQDARNAARTRELAKKLAALERKLTSPLDVHEAAI